MFKFYSVAFADLPCESLASLNKKTDIVAYACSPSTQRSPGKRLIIAKSPLSEFEASLGYCLKKKLCICFFKKIECVVGCLQRPEFQFLEPVVIGACEPVDMGAGIHQQSCSKPSSGLHGSGNSCVFGEAPPELQLHPVCWHTFPCPAPTALHCITKHAR